MCIRDSYYVKFMKPKQNVKGSTDLDEFDFDEYDEDCLLYTSRCV